MFVRGVCQLYVLYELRNINSMHTLSLIEKKFHSTFGTGLFLFFFPIPFEWMIVCVFVYSSILDCNKKKWNKIKPKKRNSIQVFFVSYHENLIKNVQKFIELTNLKMEFIKYNFPFGQFVFFLVVHLFEFCRFCWFCFSIVVNQPKSSIDL